MPLTIPHAAMQVPEDDAAPFREKWPQFEETIGKYAGVEVVNPIARFAGMVTRMDRAVGEVLAVLEELGLDDNTLVIFTSDNGPHQEGGHSPKFFNSSGSLRGIKRDLYEGGIRVPMLARWPGVITPGSESDHVSAFWDVLPTLADAAGFAAPDGLDGISFLPTLKGNADAQAKHEHLYWEFHERGGKQAVRKGNWKAVRLNVSKNPDGPIELYDLESDLYETNNVAGRLP